MWENIYTLSFWTLFQCCSSQPAQCWNPLIQFLMLRWPTIIKFYSVWSRSYEFATDSNHCAYIKYSDGLPRPLWKSHLIHGGVSTHNWELLFYHFFFSIFIHLSVSSKMFSHRGVAFLCIYVPHSPGLFNSWWKSMLVWFPSYSE